MLRAAVASDLLPPVSDGPAGYKRNSVEILYSASLVTQVRIGQVSSIFCDQIFKEIHHAIIFPNTWALIDYFG